MSDRAAIEQLARIVGIEVRYTDTFGHSHKVSDETLRALIAAFGLPPDPAVARGELVERRRRAPLGLGPVHLVDAEAAHPELALHVPDGCREISWVCRLESGEERSGRLAAASGREAERVAGISVAASHHLTQERARSWPRAMVPTATHDTKRGEDARARLALLTEMPRDWSNRLSQWLRLNRSRRVEVDGEIVPERDVEYLFYQALLGAWPPDLAPDDVAGVKRLGERIEAYMIKEVREGKQQSSWSNPNTAYEAALQHFVRTVLDASRLSPFLTEFYVFVTSLARLGAVVSLSQLVLKADCAWRARHLSGRRVVGLQPGPSRQSPAGGLGRSTSVIERGRLCVVSRSRAVSSSDPP